MKRRAFIKSGISGVAGLAISTAVIAEQGSGKGHGKGRFSLLSSEEERAMLVHMCEEEKLARDVYRVMFDRWGSQVFSKISNAEERRMAALEGRLGYYRVPDPIPDDATGAFSSTPLANTYLELVDWGMKSEKDAFMVGAYVEERDILDLKHSIRLSQQPDLLALYGRLMRGSRNHLRAFVHQLENLGYVYQEQLMEQSEVDAIVDSPVELGGFMRHGPDMHIALL